MKHYHDGVEITREELKAMAKEELQELAKANQIKLYSVNRDKMIESIFTIWNQRVHKGDAFRG